MHTRYPYRWHTSYVVVLLACILACLVGAPVLAADLNVAPIYRAPAPVINWAGSYIGVGGGADWGTANEHNGFTGDQTGAFDLHGGILGTTSGFNFQNENLVYGFEGNTSLTGKRAGAVDLPPNAAFSNQVQEPWLSTYRGRLGYTQNNWMIYATGGAALTGMDNGAIGPAGQIPHWHWGWTVGGGVEMRLTQDWSAKVEYLYLGLQDKSYFNPAPVPFQSQHTSPDDHVLRVGVNYKLPWSILDSYFKR